MTNSKFEAGPASPGGSRARRGSNESDWQTGSEAISDSPRGQSPASGSGATLGRHVKELLADQVGSGAEMLGRFAAATRKAADDLDRESPQVASFVGGMAERLDSYAEALRGQSVDDLVSAASDYTRRKPALVFGVAALAGFVVMRTFKNASATENRAHGQQRPLPNARRQSNVY